MLVRRNHHHHSIVAASVLQHHDALPNSPMLIQHNHHRCPTLLPSSSRPTVGGILLVLELTGNVVRNNKRNRIVPRHNQFALRNDGESVTFVNDVVLPNNNQVLLPKNSWKGKNQIGYIWQEL
ncbi:hypothetical protein RHMOL_Rhmol06G0107900 [Rhododendron molle]|uniref:Uncharacterized protein n=1 Tax=Rhododendron molle TaxID=49168 RepID=A0ACC0NCL0_RHOML|nr:hypothetical protein RHMOL_Rhmol06G0107900 [Rhododendron molle]